MPTISRVTDVTIFKNEESKVTISVGGFGPDSLSLIIQSTNQLLLPTNNVTITRRESEFEVLLKPASNSVGSTWITVVVSDSRVEARTSFRLTVLETNRPPNVLFTNVPVLLLGTNRSAVGVSVDDRDGDPVQIAFQSSTNLLSEVRIRGSDTNILFAASIFSFATNVVFDVITSSTGKVALRIGVSDGKMNFLTNMSFVISNSLPQPATSSSTRP